MEQEIRHLLTLLKSNEPINRELGELLFEYYKQSPIFEKIIKEELKFQCYPDFQLANASFIYTGAIRQEKVNDVVSKIGDIISGNRQNLSFESNIQKRKYGKQTMDFLHWLYCFLQKYATKQIALLFDQPQGSQEAVVILQEPVDAENVTAKISFWESINEALIKLDSKELDNIRTIIRSLKTDTHPINLLQLIETPIKFLILPSTEFQPYLMIQKITVNFFIWRQDFIDR